MSGVNDSDGTDDDGNIVEDISKIRGDAIGDTMYSERFVLRVLIKLSELSEESWNSDLEQDLCLLWDMTIEKDVISFLMDHNFFDLFCKVMRVTNVGRCIEVMVGIVGNMTCIEETRAPLADHEAAILLINLITSEDSLVLVQLLRLLNTCLWNERVEEEARPPSPASGEDSDGSRTEEEEFKDVTLSPWLTVIVPHKELLLQHLRFFLSSATNEELLCLTLDLIGTLLKIPALSLPPIVATSAEFAAGMAECLRQLLRGVKAADSESGNKRLWKGYEVWLSIVGVMASCQEGRVNLGANGDILTKCFTKLVVLLTTPEVLKAQDPEMAVLCVCVLETLETTIQVSATVLARLIGVLCDLHSGFEIRGESSEESFQVSHLLYRASQFVKICLERTEEITALIKLLNLGQVRYLECLVSDDEVLSENIAKGILQLRTNGLVQ